MRRVLLAVAAAMGLGTSPLHGADETRSTTWLQRRLESGLSQALGGTARIGRIDVDWSSLAATVGDVAITVPVEGAPPMTATIGEGRIKLAWEGVAGIAAGRIHISEVVAKRASFSISRDWIDGWRPRAAKKEGHVEIRIDKLVVDDATAEYSDRGLELRVRASGLDLRGDWSTSRRSLVAEATGSATVEAPLFARPWTAAVRGGLRLGAGRLEIFSGHAEGTGATAELKGNVTWGAGASFTAEGRVNADLDTLSPFLPGRLGLGGRVEGPVQIVLAAGAPVRVTMQAATTRFRVGPVASESGRGSLTLRPGRLDVGALTADAYGGAFEGSLGLAFAHGEVILETDLTGRGADLARLIALSGKPLPVAADADVTFKMTGDPGNVAAWTGGGTFDARPRSGRGSQTVPAGGRGTLTFGDGRVRVRSDRLELGEAAVAFDLEANLALAVPSTRVTIEGVTRDAAATQAAALKLLDALGVPRNRFTTEPVAGSGTVRAVVRAGATTHVDLSFDLRDGSWAGEPFTTARIDVAVDDDAVNLKRLEVARDGQDLSGRLQWNARAASIDDVELHARNVRLAPLLAKLGQEFPVDGAIDLDLEGRRTNGDLAAAGTLYARSVVVGREILDTVESPVRIENGLVILEGLVARGASLEARARVVYDIEKARAEIDVLSAALQLEACRTLAEAGVVARGVLHASGPLAVDREGPSGLLSFTANEFLVDTRQSGIRELRLGDLEGTGAFSPRGLELSVKAVPASAWTFDAFLGWQSTLPISAVLYFDDLLIGAGGAFGESADVRMKGQVQAEGELTDPRALEINSAFDEVAVRFGPRTLHAQAPFALKVESGRFVLGPATFEGDDAHLELGADGSITGGELAGFMKGRLDLSLVSALWSDLRGGGALVIDAALAGSIDHPDLRGSVALHDGRLRLLGSAQSLEHIDAEAIFEGQTLRLGSFHASQGGGEVTAVGSIVFEGLSPASYEAQVTAANITVTYPEGFKGTYQGRVAMVGTPKGALVSGRIDVVRGVYAKDFDLTLTGTSRREFGDDQTSALPKNVALDVDIVAPGNVWIRNDIASLEATGQLHVGGELRRLELTGRVALVPGGTVRYRDVDYRLESGTLDLTDTRRINPYVDVRGRTRVADYDITLHVEGTLDHFEYELTSLPPLSSQDIISVLMTGKTLDSVSGASAAAELPADMAAYYFAGLLNETFGRQLQSSLGIDQFQITPLLLKGEGDPTARVTVGKRVNDAVKVVFSQDIGTAQKQTYQVVMDATRRIRVIAESDSDSGLGGEVQYSQQFGGAKPLRETLASGDAPGAIGSIQLQGEGAAKADELIKAAKQKVGDPFGRGKMLEGGDKIRAKLVKQGYLQSDVRSEAVRDEAGGGVYRIVYTVTLGPKVRVEVVTADGKGERGLRKTLRTFWRETPYAPDLLDEATTVLLTDLRSDGYYAAEAVWHVTDKDGVRTIRFDVDRGKPVRLRSLTFTGVHGVSLERIEAQMESLRKSGLRKRRLRPDVLTQDLAAVRALYRDEGFTRVRIERPEVALAASGDAADVRVAIDEGTRFTVGDITYPDLAVTEVAGVTKSSLREGAVFSPRRLAESEQGLREAFDAKGFPDVTVETNVALVAATADVAYDVQPGNRKTVGEVVIEGNEVTRRKTIASALTFGQGDVVSRDALLKSQQRLYRTGLFSSVRMTFAPEDGPDPSVQRVTVKVAEAPPWALGLGIGYDSEDGPRASFLLGYSNLGGRNVALAVQGLVSGNDERAQVTIRHRKLFGAAIDSLASLFFEKSIETGFTEWRRSFSMRVERRPKPRWVQFIRYTLQEVKIGDITDVEAAVEEIFEDKLSDIRLGSIGLGLVRDTRDDAFLPTRGGYGSIEASVFSDLLGSEASFGKLFLRGSWVKSFKRGSRFMSFIRIGAEYPWGGTDVVPLSERFFAGGANTMRGFELDSVGGLDVAGFNAGGEALLVLNEEWHFPIWKAFRGELFLDVGNVYPKLSDFDVTDIRSSAGLGLRIDTPIGPIRVEYGWKLDREEGETPGEFIFAIGAVF